MKQGEACILGPFNDITLVESDVSKLGELSGLLTAEFAGKASYTERDQIARVVTPRLDDAQKQKLTDAGFKVVRDDFQFALTF